MKSKYAISALLLPFALLSTGCPAPQEMLREYSSDYVAFCGTVQDGEGNPVSGPVIFHMEAVWLPSAWVMTFEGEAMLDSRGIGCVNLSRIPAARGSYTRVRPADVEVVSLSATVGEVTISGIFTDVDLSVWSVIRAEGLFDLSVPNPGEPGMLAILEPAVPASGGLGTSELRTSSTVDPTGPRAPVRGRSSSGSAAI